MTAQLIDGRQIAADVRADVAREVEEMAAMGVRPGLAVVLVGEDPASQVYVRMKAKACREAGIEARDLTLSEDTSQDDLLDLIDELNADPSVNGILVQLPLPDQIDAQLVMERILPEKDVDGFHPVNIGRMASGDTAAFRPATPAGVQEMLKRIDYDPSGKHAVVVGRSNIVGRPMAAILTQKEPWANATVTVAHSRTQDMADVCRLADLLIVAIGRPEFVTADMVKEGAVVIDVGVNRVDDPSRERGYRLVGDVAFDEARAVAGAITPVPGGVGPMTIACLLGNTLTACRRQHGISES